MPRIKIRIETPAQYYGRKAGDATGALIGVFFVLAAIPYIIAAVVGASVYFFLYFLPWLGIAAMAFGVMIAVQEKRLAAGAMFMFCFGLLLVGWWAINPPSVGSWPFSTPSQPDGATTVQGTPTTAATSDLDFEADRAAHAVKKTWAAEGLTGLRQNVDECYPRARELRTERSAIFCFSFDYLTATRYGDDGDRSDRLEKVQTRIGALLDYDDLHTGDRAETIASWTDAADRAYGGAAPRSVPARPSSSMQCVPSFDCNTDQRVADRLVCSNADLCESDRRMAALYDEARTNADAAASARIQEEQRVWWSSRRNACADADCLREAYRERIQDLSRTDDGPKSSPQAPPVSAAPDLYCQGVVDYARARARGAREYARGRGLASAGPEGDWRTQLSPEDVSRCFGGVLPPEE